MGKSSDTDTTENDGHGVHERLTNTVDGDTDPSQCASGALETQTVHSSSTTQDEPEGCQAKLDTVSSAEADPKETVSLHLDRSDQLMGPDRATIEVYDVKLDSMDAGAHYNCEPDSNGHTKNFDSTGGHNTGDATNAIGLKSSPSSMNSAWAKADQLISSQVSPFGCNIDTSKYPPSCIVKLPPGLSSGDQLTIRWPALKPSQNAAAAEKSIEVKSSKRRRSDDGCPSEEDTALLVKITLPTKVKAKMKQSYRHVKVFAPWITVERAAVNTLTARQLRSIGIDGHDGCNAILRRSRRQRIRNHGEGNFSVGHSRIGDRYQVSVTQIPCASTWGKDLLVRSESTCCEGNISGGKDALAKNDQIWDAALSEEALNRGEPLYEYIESLHTFQKARGMMTLHQSAYKVTLSEQLFHSQTVVDIPFPDAPEPAGFKCQKPHSMLEGTPLSTHERTAFNEAILEYRKQWPKIAKAGRDVVIISKARNSGSSLMYVKFAMMGGT
ncbi:hypothetical protein ACHAW5_008926 [Stephanodiscus triporus]|uniref:Uncharacterized protein n=1 Tax=Stephanodiscus triporus TaxID=2934178 RepID=A0ABD3MJV8_9STRA